MNNRNHSYHGYRFPPEIIGYSVWLYRRVCLSFRDVEDLLAERGIVVSYETIRSWCNTTVQRTLDRSENVEVVSAILGTRTCLSRRANLGEACFQEIGVLPPIPEICIMSGKISRRVE